jgi:hypothetical protein
MAGELEKGPEEYPSASLPVVFADGVASLNWTFGVVKVYLTRYDPHIRVAGPGKEQLASQLVLPIRGFVATALLFRRALDSMVADGTLSQQMLEEAQEADQNAKRQRPIS